MRPHASRLILGPRSLLLLLRNHLAHAAGLPTAAARSLLETHQPGVFALLRAVAQAGQGTQVIALTGTQAVRLAGPRPCPIPRPAEMRDGTDGPWLITASGVLPLMPLAAFGPVRLVDGASRVAERPGDPAAQLYLRAGRDRLAYVPLGRDEAMSLTFDLDAFRALFRLDDGLATHGRSGADGRWDDFRREARILAEDLVGRAAELGVLRDWLKGRDTREAGIALITGAPGVGKSLLMARLARDQGNAGPERLGLYYHRFRGGDARNCPRAFLRGLLAALAGWGLLPAPRDNLGRDRGLGYVLPALPRSLADAFPGQGTFLSSHLRGHHHPYQRSVQTDCPGHPDGIPVPRRRRL